MFPLFWWDGLEKRLNLTLYEEYSIKMEKEEFINPIDKDKIADQPGLLPYASNVGGFVIKPFDRGRIKGQAMDAMRQQTERQLAQIRQQIELLADQARQIQRRVEVSELIYQSEISFRPLIGQTYYLYQREDQTGILSMIGPEEWGRKGCPYPQFVAKVHLLSDHTWEILS